MSEKRWDGIAVKKTGITQMARLLAGLFFMVGIISLGMAAENGGSKGSVEKYFINSEAENNCYELEIQMPESLVRWNESCVYRLKDDESSVVLLTVFTSLKRITPAVMRSAVLSSLKSCHFDGGFSEVKGKRFYGYQLTGAQDDPDVGLILQTQSYVAVDDSVIIGIVIACDDRKAATQLLSEFFRNIDNLKLQKINKSSIPADIKLTENVSGEIKEEELYRKMGGSLFDQKKYDQALVFISRAIAIDPRNYILYISRGWTFNMLKQYDKGIEDFNRAIELKPEDSAAYYSRGIAYHELKQYDKAIQSYDKAIALKKDYAKAYQNRAMALFFINQYEKAIQDYTKLIELKYNLDTAYFDRGLAYYKMKKYEQSIADYTKAIEQNVNYINAYLNRGIAFNKIKQYEKSLTDFSKVIELKPDSLDAYYCRAVVYFRLKRYEDSVRDYCMVIRLGENTPEVYMFRGIAYSRNRQYDLAEADYNKAIELKPDLEKAFSRRASLYFRTGQYDKGMTGYEKAISMQPQEITTYFNMIEDLLIAGQFDNANLWRAKLIAAVPKDKITDFDRPILQYLGCVCNIVQGKPWLAEEEQLQQLQKKDVDVGWDFELIEEWLKNQKNGLSKLQIDKIRGLTDRMKSMQVKK